MRTAVLATLAAAAVACGPASQPLPTQLSTVGADIDHRPSGRAVVVDLLAKSRVAPPLLPIEALVEPVVVPVPEVEARSAPGPAISVLAWREPVIEREPGGVEPYVDEPAPGHQPATVLAERPDLARVLACIRFYESTDNYAAVNGPYRGAYQFDRPTWESVGGSGDPAEADREEQDNRAALLYLRRGLNPWPSLWC